MGNSVEDIKKHSQDMALESLKNHFPSEKIETLRQYLKEPTIHSKSNKRFYHVHFHKRSRAEMPTTYVQDPKMEEQYPTHMKPTNVIPSTVIIDQPNDQNVVMPTNMTII